MDDPGNEPARKKTRYQKDKERGPNEAIGVVDCPICGKAAPVFKRRDRVGRKYYNCGECGQNYCVKATAQAWLNENMRPLESEQPEPENKPEPKPVVVDEEPSFLDGVRKFVIGD